MSVRDPDHSAPEPSKPLVHPLGAAMVVIYATLGLLALTVPRGLVNWSRDREPSMWQQATLTVAQVIERFSNSTRLNRPYERGRETFLSVTGKSED
jgi:hypothetical protein